MSDYYQNGGSGRFRTPIQGGQVKSRYDLGTADLTDQQQRDVVPINTQRFAIDGLAAVQRIHINAPGRAFSAVFQRIDGAPPVVDAHAFIRINKDREDCELFLRPGVGYYGDFYQLFLYIPAGISGVNQQLELIIHHFDDVPYFLR